MKDNKLKVGTLCTVTKSDPSIWYKSDKSGYWVVTAIDPSRRHWTINAFSLKHQREFRFHPRHLKPVENT